MRLTIAAGATLGALGVLAGAFGAHALKRSLEPSQLATWDTAAEYQLVHAILLVALGVFGLHQLHEEAHRRAGVRALYVSVLCVLTGIVTFSGSLYAWSLTSIQAFVMLTPVGGVLLVAGWLALATSAIRGLRS